tara:strand:+ start:212 stop:1129 length:918 start_codon:yes stop_codon:yes gene_type:complete
MIDAICTFDNHHDEAEIEHKVYSIFEFKNLPESEINRLRYSLLCPACKQVAYFRKASRDGKQACFGSRYHDSDCKEFNPSARKSEEEKDIAEVESLLLEADSLQIDFSLAIKKPKSKTEVNNVPSKTINEKQKSTLITTDGKVTLSGVNTSDTTVDKSDLIQPKINKQGLSKLLTSLLRGSTLASSDLWIYTSEKHKWRAKNLFVNINQAVPTENGAPRMYWGTISHADKTLHWLNPAEERSISIPISQYREALLSRFDIQETRDIEGAGFIMFAKCIESKDKKRKFLQLWGNDVDYFYISKAEE